MPEMDKESLTDDLQDVANKRRAEVLRQQLNEVIQDIQEGEYDE